MKRSAEKTNWFVKTLHKLLSKQIRNLVIAILFRTGKTRIVVSHRIIEINVSYAFSFIEREMGYRFYIPMENSPTIYIE